MKTTKTRPTGRRGIAYLRTSKDAQEKQRQRDIILRWCREKGIEPAEWIEDSGARDLSYKRTGFQQLLKLVQDGQADWIVIAERDRLGYQDAWEYGHFIHTFRSNGVELWAATEDKQLTTTNDRIEPILASLEADKSQREQGGNAERVQTSKRERVERGEWTGGKPPYGYDLVARDRAGREVYRLVHEPGQYRRVCHYPDGTVRRFDGPHNLPGRDAGVAVYVEKTLDPAAADWVRKIFRWFADGFSYRKIASQLNAHQVPALYKPHWVGPTVAGILANPVYALGVPVYNKAAHGRFQEWVGGKLTDVTRVNGKAKAGRKRDESDHFHAEPRPTNALIDAATWNKVQTRIRAQEAAPKAERRPRNPDLYLNVTCTDCDSRMTAWAQQHAYRCTTNMHDGTRCRCNKTRHETVELLVFHWLEECNAALDLLYETPGDYLKELDLRAEPLVREYTRLVTQMWRKAKEANLQPPAAGPHDQKVWTFAKLKALYGEAAGEAAEDFAGRIEAKEREKERLAKRIGLVDDEEAAKAIAGRIREVTAELRSLREKARPAADRGDVLRGQIKGLLDQFRRVQEEVETALPLRKGELIREVVDQIRVKHVERRMGKLRASRLVEVEIIPKVGGVKAYRDGEKAFADAVREDEGEQYGSPKQWRRCRNVVDAGPETLCEEGSPARG